ncbi:MAG: hypothetical protein RIC30_04540 [Marinoscillum sp.]|uniref:hypothetical protein n=1 Tax=Marinoscillum sp. TaxID=2024838 RepID=UPI003302B1FC
MPVKLLILLAMYSASACQSNDLYLIADENTLEDSSYPKQTSVEYEERNITYICFTSRKVNLFGPYCFTSHDERAEKIGDLSGLEGEIWDQHNLDEFLFEYLLDNGQENKLVDPTVNSSTCAGLLNQYQNVFLLVKAEEYYYKYQVVSCTSVQE